MKEKDLLWKVHPIFPTPVYISHLGRNFLKKEIKYIENCKTNLLTNHGNFVSKEKYVLNKLPMLNLKKDLLKHINKYLKEVINTDNNVSLYITQSWLNYTNKNQYHHEHFHGNSYLSGVLYIKAKEDTDKIYFHKKNKEVFEFSIKNYNLFNSTEWFFNRAETMIILFPSYLMHSVSLKNDDNERISLAFNVYVKGKIGNCNEITELILE